MAKKIFEPSKNCQQCKGTGYVSVPGHWGGRCSCTVVGKPVQEK